MAGEVPKVPNSDPPTTLNNGNNTSNSGNNKSGNWKQAHYPNPPDSHNPDLSTLREQWKFAIRQYSRWYSQAWGTAIFAGISFFALGWFIKGSNPLPSISSSKRNENNNNDDNKPQPNSWFLIVQNCVYVQWDLNHWIQVCSQQMLLQMKPQAECWSMWRCFRGSHFLFCLLYPVIEPSFYLFFFL